MRAAPPTAAIPLTLAALFAGGCGNERQRPPDVTGTQKPAGTARIAYPAGGLSLTAPHNWYRSQGSRPLVALIASGPATVAVWRYPRTERLPRTKAELKAARDALIAAATKADSTFQVIKAAPATIAGKPAVQIRARETIAGQPRTVRSTHIYAARSEIVIDAYSDANTFHAVDAKFFRPLLKTLTVRQPTA